MTTQQWLAQWEDPRAYRAAVAVAATIALVLVIVISPGVSRARADDLFGTLRSPGEVGFVAGHRGDLSGAPENTLPAFQRAADSAVAFIETDVQLTADGVPVLMHDWMLDRTTNGTGPVWNKTLEQIKRLDAGSWFSERYVGTRVPTLDEFLEVLEPSQSRAMLELKGAWTPEQVAMIVALVRDHQVSARVVFASFDLGTLRNLRAAAGEIPRVIIARQIVGDPAVLAAACGAAGIVTSRAFVETNPGIVDEVHAAGLGILIYTLNDEGNWLSAIALGVDGIITDLPTRFERWLAGS